MMELNDEEIILSSRGQYSVKYSQDDLSKAIEKIRNNEMTYGIASKTYNVPKTTLYNKMQNPENGVRGATTILSKEQEDELAEWVLLNSDFGDPRTKEDIMLAASEIAQLDPDKSNHFKNGLPSSKWMEGFLKRHPDCRYRKPEAVSKASAVNTKEDFAGLWRNIYKYLEKTDQLHLLNKPEIWWNADETGFEKDVLPKRVVARKGIKRVSRREMGAPKDVTTVTYAFSAAGDYVEPLITLKNSNSTVAEIAFALGTVGANYAINQTESGWVRRDSFYYYVMYLHQQWNLKQIPKPRILTIDGYRAHFTLRLFRWARLNDLIIIVLYPGGTPYIQMCDTTMFGPMKEKHKQLYSQWRLNNPTKVMNEAEFVKILKQINDVVIKKESIINGWRATGLQPFNFNNLNTDSLMSKSPDRLFDFKGDYIDSPEMTSNSKEMGSKSPINVVDCVVLEPTSELYIQQDNLFQLLTTRETLDHQMISSNSSRDENTNASFVLLDMDDNRSQNTSLVPQKNVSLISEMVVDVDVIEDRNVTVPVSSKQNVSLDPDQAGVITNAVKFSELTGNNRIFQSQFDTNFDLGTFGLTEELITDKASISKIGNLVDKIRRDVKQLGLLCAAVDKEKLVNVLVINQQLTLIDPPKVVQLVSNEPEPRTMETILKPPMMPKRAKPKCKRNLKVSYGVVTADEIVDEMEKREADDRQQEIEREEAEIAKNDRENEIKELDGRLREIRVKLSNLRTENTVKNKELLQKKKNKNFDETESNVEVEAKHERQNVIKEYNDQLNELREKIKDLKAVNIAAKKSVSIKRKNYLQDKKEQGNRIEPSIRPNDDDIQFGLDDDQFGLDDDQFGPDDGAGELDYESN